MPRPPIALSLLLASQLGCPVQVLARTGFAFTMTGGAQIPAVTATAGGNGTVVLNDDGTEAQLHVEFAGLLFVNVHSVYSLNDEIRGQILPDKTPVEPTTFGRLKRLFER